MKNMKTILCLAGLLLAVNFPASAALFQYGTLNGLSAAGQYHQFAVLQPDQSHQQPDIECR